MTCIVGFVRDQASGARRGRDMYEFGNGRMARAKRAERAADIAVLSLLAALAALGAGIAF